MRKSAAQTHGQLLSIIKVLSDNRTLDLSGAIHKVKEISDLSNAEDEWIQRSIDLALRVWLTINIRERELEDQTPHTPCLQWKANNTSLSEFVRNLFQDSSTCAPADSELGSRFTVVNMVYSNGLQVEWTECLADHLSVNLAHRKVRIYYLKQCLFDHMKGSGKILNANGPILPAALLKETIWTLNLLFSPDDQQTRNFLMEQKIPRSLYKEEPSEGKRHLDLNDYTYWRQRLLELRKISKMEPETVGQYLHRQRPAERLNLILTIVAGFFLALVFGVISSVTAVISMKASLDSLEISRQSLALQKQVTICPCS